VTEWLVTTLSVRYAGQVFFEEEIIMTLANEQKSERIDIRTSPSVKQLLQSAAQASHKNVSEFLLDAGLVAADQALADRQRFSLDDAHWAAFQQALDAPVRSHDRLKKLLTQPGLLDK